MNPGLTETPAWQELLRHRDALKTRALSDIILGDDRRLERCELALGSLRLNYALNFVTPETMGLLAKLAGARDVAGWRDRMLRGEKINQSENRAALHVALRQSGDAPVVTDGRDVMPEIKAARRRVAEFAAAVRDGRMTGATGKRILHVVNIGIGGSDLGPRLAVGALASFASGPEVHFAANADAFELTRLFKRVDPAETLFVVVSKTFTTEETLLNAGTARAWLAEKLGKAAVARHFAAVSMNGAAAASFGVAPEYIFPLWDWVGGRTSLWSAAGLSIALAVGPENFGELLRGAEAMDAHFKTAPPAENMPVVLAMLGVWSRNFLNCAAHAVLPYSERLRELPRYLQQLEMESNGKTTGRDGKPVPVKTAPVIFGECGTVGQHSFHQWLHQGSDIASADFIGVVRDDLAHPDHHRALLANLAAQAGALAFGQKQAATPQDVYPGNRPSTILMLDRLDPSGLGRLLALYEHKVFVQSVIWGTNPFDQPGVELGKRLARSLADGAETGDSGGGFPPGIYAKIST
jgi:glucose-6-phosphate isomerase